MTVAKKMRYYISVNFLCDTDGAEPTQEQLNEAFRTMLKESQKPNVSLEFEIWDVMDQEEMS